MADIFNYNVGQSRNARGRYLQSSGQWGAAPDQSIIASGTKYVRNQYGAWVPETAQAQGVFNLGMAQPNNNYVSPGLETSAGGSSNSLWGRSDLPTVQTGSNQMTKGLETATSPHQIYLGAMTGDPLFKEYMALRNIDPTGSKLNSIENQLIDEYGDQFRSWMINNVPNTNAPIAKDIIRDKGISGPQMADASEYPESGPDRYIPGLGSNFGEFEKHIQRVTPGATPEMMAKHFNNTKQGTDDWKNLSDEEFYRKYGATRDQLKYYVENASKLAADFYGPDKIPDGYGSITLNPSTNTSMYSGDSQPPQIPAGHSGSNTGTTQGDTGTIQGGGAEGGQTGSTGDPNVDEAVNTAKAVADAEGVDIFGTLDPDQFTPYESEYTPEQIDKMADMRAVINRSILGMENWEDIVTDLQSRVDANPNDVRLQNQLKYAKQYQERFKTDTKALDTFRKEREQLITDTFDTAMEDIARSTLMRTGRLGGSYDIMNRYDLQRKRRMDEAILGDTLKSMESARAQQELGSLGGILNYIDGAIKTDVGMQNAWNDFNKQLTFWNEDQKNRNAATLLNLTASNQAWNRAKEQYATELDDKYEFAQYSNMWNNYMTDKGFAQNEKMTQLSNEFQEYMWNAQKGYEESVRNAQNKRSIASGIASMAVPASMALIGSTMTVGSGGALSPMGMALVGAGLGGMARTSFNPMNTSLYGATPQTSSTQNTTPTATFNAAPTVLNSGTSQTKGFNGTSGAGTQRGTIQNRSYQVGPNRSNNLYNL